MQTMIKIPMKKVGRPNSLSTRMGAHPAYPQMLTQTLKIMTFTEEIVSIHVNVVNAYDTRPYDTRPYGITVPK